MNCDEVYEIKRTWEIAMTDPTKSGVAILERFFIKYPSNLKKFTQFMDVPLTELVHTSRFKWHANRIMKVFDDSIQALGNDWAPVKLEEIWSKIATTHFHRQIEKKAFNELKEVILEVLTAACNLNQMQSELWAKLMDSIYDIIFNTLDKLENDQQ